MRGVGIVNKCDCDFWGGVGSGVGFGGVARGVGEVDDVGGVGMGAFDMCGIVAGAGIVWSKVDKGQAGVVEEGVDEFEDDVGMVVEGVEESMIDFLPVG